MPVNFPDTPNIGDTFTVGTNTFEWDGTKWVVISTDGIDVSDATAEVSDVLASETFYAGEDADIKTGVIPSKTAETFTPGTTNQTISAGQYLSEDQTISGDADLSAGNIKTGVNIFGVDGTFTADATATAGDILNGETAYVNGLEVTGTIPSKTAETFTPGTADQTITAGQYLAEDQTILGDADLLPENIRDAKTIFGVTGTLVEEVRAATPTLTFVSKTFEEIVFTITNNDNETAVIVWEIDDNTPDENSIELNANETSSNITLSSLNSEQTYTIYAFATTADKAQSEAAILAQTTYGQTPAPTISNVDPGETSVTFDLTNNDNEFEVIAYYDVNDSTPDTTVTIPAGQTVERTVSGLSDDTSYTLYARAKAAPKSMSNTVSSGFTTDASPTIQATGGTTTTYTDGGNTYKSHTFTSSGTFTVTYAGEAPYNELDYLIIAGGGSGGTRDAGGGGAGGYRTTVGTSGGNSSAESKITANAQSYSITVGAGGNGVVNYSKGNNGSNSSALGITSTGGGAGAAFSSSANSGGSGGGAGSSASSGSGTSGQGFGGGGSSGFDGGGGGGAGQSGQNASGNNGGDGGDGLASIIRNGTSETRAGGGGGGGENTVGLGGNGGASDGMPGPLDRAPTDNATANTGSGSGGNRFRSDSGNGGSGIVIIRYQIG